MAKGAIAKENIAIKLREVFGADYVGEVDKKHYLWADDGGERVQIAITMTCPKNPIGAVSAFGDSASVETIKPAAAEITDEERNHIADLMAKLGL